MKLIDWKGGAATPIDTLTKVFLVDDESDVNASLREVLDARC
jgi:hypothetical protein